MAYFQVLCLLFLAAQRFTAAKFRSFSLGPRILRSEVATVAALVGDPSLVGACATGKGMVVFVVRRQFWNEMDMLRVKEILEYDWQIHSQLASKAFHCWHSTPGLGRADVDSIRDLLMDSRSTNSRAKESWRWMTDGRKKVQKNLGNLLEGCS